MNNTQENILNFNKKPLVPDSTVTTYRKPAKQCDNKRNSRREKTRLTTFEL